jgi:regulator of sigma E protease
MGIMITLHEFGHFIAARIFGMEVREFAIGMGPAIYKRKRKEDEEGNPIGTAFSLRAFPIGGFCDLGEDSESDNPRSFVNKPRIQRCIVLAAGSIMNLLLGFLVTLILFLAYVGGSYQTTKISALADDFPYGNQIQVGDEIVNINGNAIHTYTDLRIFIARDTDKPYTITFRRDGKTFKVNNIERTLTSENGEPVIGMTFGHWDKLTLPRAFENAWYTATGYVRVVRVSLSDLFTGRVKPTDMMGPVGIGSEINNIVTQEESFGDVVSNLANLTALLSVNLAVFNLLPIPALDGGRILFLFISFLLLKIRKKPLSPTVEGRIHGVIFLLLIGLIIFVFFNDIMRLVGG